MKKSRFTNSQKMDPFKSAESGILVPDLYTEVGISTAPFYKRRAKSGGVDTSMLSTNEGSGEENHDCKRCTPRRNSEPWSRQRRSQEGSSGRSLRHEIAKRAVKERSATIQLICEIFRVSQSIYR